MDRLHADVTRLVAEAAAQHEDAGLTFTRIRELVGEAGPQVPAAEPHARRPPRLTEAWFC
jgi:hypothetical protein